MPAYNQDKVIDKINSYLKSKKRKLTLEYGYCHGITLLWLYKMSEGNEEWFYDLIKKIVSHTGENFDDIEMDIEKFLSHIEWLQSPYKYVFDVPQFAIHKSLELPLESSLSYIFNHASFSKALEKSIAENKMICLSGPTHTIGVFKKENIFYVFDPNYDSGEPKPIDSIKNLKNEIVNSLFKEFKISTRNLPVLINIVGSDKPSEKKEMTAEPDSFNKVSFFKSLINTTKKVNIRSVDGISPLHLAAESGDEEEIKLLLDTHTNIEQVTKDGRTPLFIAATYGYVNIVKRLLEAKANPNTADENKITALKCAAGYSHEEIVKLLLRNGADINQSDKNNKTPLYVAAQKGHHAIVKILLEEKADIGIANNNKQTPLNAALTASHWDTALLILEHIKNIKALKFADIKKLRKHKKEMINAIQNKQSIALEIGNLALIERLLSVNSHSTRKLTKKSTKSRPMFFPYSRKDLFQTDENSAYLRPVVN